MDEPDTKEMSYYRAAKSPAGQRFIRITENLTGRIGALLRLRGLAQDMVKPGADLWENLWSRFGMRLKLSGAPRSVLDTPGPLLIIANHPFGMADGMALLYLMTRTGRDFRLIANDVLWQIEAMRPYILPFNVTKSKGGLRANLATRAAAIERLQAGGVVVVFPSGATAAASTPFGPVREAPWSNFAAKLVQESGATVLPVFFEGANPRVFQAAPFIHLNLRYGLQLHALRRKMGKKIEITLGTPFKPDLTQSKADLTMDMRRAVLSLARDPYPAEEHGPVW